MTAPPTVPRYEQLADDIEAAVRRGVFVPGERIPSVRRASEQHGVSIKTVVHAYALLESRGVIESRPQSGFFVKARPVVLEGPNAHGAHSARTARAGQASHTSHTSHSAHSAHSAQAAKPRGAGSTTVPMEPVHKAAPAPVDVSRLVLSTLRSIVAQDAVPLGSPYPDPALFPWRRINQYANAIARRHASWNLIDDLPPGNPELIRQIARRYAENGADVDPEEIVITVGATEAINLSLQAVAKPGDSVVVESPTYYAMLHAIERLGMRAIEVSTHPETGIDLDALERVLARKKVAACMVMPNFQNPLGFRMPEAHMKRLVALAEAHDLPVIENDVYQELYFGPTRPSSLKQFDTRGLVLHCASFSKSLSASYRIGWALPGRYRAQVEKLKFLNTLTTPSVPQVALADYLRHDGYDRHLRRLRRFYRQQARLMRAMIERFFPAGTRTSDPQGGYVLWVELPPRVDSMRLYRAALAQGITIGPGYMFSMRNDFHHYIRLNYSYPWTAQTETALKTLGELAAKMA